MLPEPLHRLSLMGDGGDGGRAVDVLILRLLHIVAGAFWVGAVFTNVMFLQPIAMALGPEAGKFSYHLTRHRRFPAVILASAATTVLAGIVLLWMTTNGLEAGLLLAPSRIGFTIGGIAGILTFALGSLYVFPRTQRVVGLMETAMADGRPPSPEEQAQLARIRGELLWAGWVTVAGLAVAVVTMATARYWGLLI